MKHKIAVIGFGGMGGWHVRRLQEHQADLFEIAGIWDVQETRRQAAAEQGLHVYESLEAVLADPAVEIITIATPNNFHKPIAIAAMRAGKSVISEKPVMMNTQELEECIAVSNETGKLFTVHQNRRWDRDFLMVKKALQDKVLGEAFCIESRVLGGRRVLHGWRGYKEDGGGLVLDWGVHLIDQALQLTDAKVVSINAVGQNLYTKEVDDNFSLRLCFDNGLTAILEVMTCCFIPMPRWQVYGDLGTMCIKGWSCEGGIKQVRDDAEVEWSDSIVYTEGGTTRTMAPLPNDATRDLPLPDVQGDVNDYYRNIAACLDGTAEQIVRHDEMLRVMKLVDLAFESMATRRSVACNI